MINSSLKIHGVATLITTIALLIVSSLIIIFAANFSSTQQKSAANINRAGQAFQAAEAGLEFGINYLQQNAATILANPVGGYIPAYSDVNITNVILGNGSKFSIVYSNPLANVYSLITITATGTSADGSTTKSISQRVQKTSLLVNPGTTALTTKGNVNMSGNANITNISSNQTVNSAGNVNLSGGSNTLTSGGGSSSGHIGSDIQSNNTTLANTSQSNFIASYFGNSSTSSLQAKVQNYYSNSSDTNYRTILSGLSGTSVYINQTGGTARIDGNVTIGTAASPVLLIVNGGFTITGNVTFYGFIFIIGTSGITTTTGNINVIGGIASVDDITMSGNSGVTYNSTVLTNLQNLSSLVIYAKVPGTWKDF